MKGAGSITWPAVAVFAIALTGAIILYLFVPPNDPMRGVLITAFNGAATAAGVYWLGRRQEKTDVKVDQVVHQTNGHQTNGHHPPGDDRPGGRPGTTPQ